MRPREERDGRVSGLGEETEREDDEELDYVMAGGLLSVFLFFFFLRKPICLPEDNR